MYDEVKRLQTLSLTPSAVLGLDELARARGIIRSELVEQIGRGIIPLPSHIPLPSLSPHYPLWWWGFYLCLCFNILRYNTQTNYLSSI